MPIIINRKTQTIISKPELTQEQKDAAWEKLVRGWCKQYPEKLAKLREGVTAVKEKEE